MDSQIIQSFASLLSTITILSSLYLKVPQIINIRAKKSARGIYIRALLLEIMAYTTMMLYNYANDYDIMTYLEYPIIILQVYVMLYYVLKFENMLHLPTVHLGTVIYFLTMTAFALGILSKDLLTFMVPFCTPLSGFAKVTHIYGMIEAKNADAVSLTTWVISVATNLSRLFTIFVASADMNLMANFSISALLSSGVLFTAIYYKNKCPAQSSARRASHVHRD